MIGAGTFEAKTHFSSLLDKVSRGRAVALLVPSKQDDQAQVSTASMNY